jgi:hypothetical protein
LQVGDRRGDDLYYIEQKAEGYSPEKYIFKKVF